MKNLNARPIRLTTAQFAQLHGINKRTLHYYDAIGLFSPIYKGDNNYRYYDYSQSIELEYILMLKELHMSLEEIKEYMDQPDTCRFYRIADGKLEEIDQEIRRLKKTKDILKRQKQQLDLCRSITHQELRIGKCSDAWLATIPYAFADDDAVKALRHLRNSFDTAQCRMGFGSYITVENIREGNFEEYGGLFVPVEKKKPKPGLLLRPEGTYLYGYSIGDWSALPSLYKKMLAYASENHLILTGNAYETGLNEIAISSIEEYVTQVMIRILPADS